MILGEWTLDVDLNLLQKSVLNLLVRKPTPLTGGEIRFIIDYLEMSRREFAKLLGVTHAAVLKWENEQSRMNPATEVYLRLYILDLFKVKDREFKAFYLTINPKSLAESEDEISPLEIDANKIAC
jgi:DNA-binding transcriptional regulator YiaG